MLKAASFTAYIAASHSMNKSEEESDAAKALFSYKRFEYSFFAVSIIQCGICCGARVRPPVSDEEKSILKYKEATEFLTANLKPRFAFYKIISIFSLNILFSFQAQLLGNYKCTPLVVVCKVAPIVNFARKHYVQALHHVLLP